MKISLTILETHLNLLKSAVFSEPGVEGAAYILCTESKGEQEIRFLGREVIKVSDHHYIARRSDFLSLTSGSYVQVAKLAQRKNFSIVFVHSHPGGYLDYSEQDNHEELKLQHFFRNRVENQTHGSLILTENGIVGRVFKDGFTSIDRVRVIGDRFAFHDRVQGSVANQQLFDRQIRAFGPEVQRLFQRLHIGVVGAGGTGSAVIEHLIRLGVGTISVFDGEKFDQSNINRVYGSSIRDVGKLKTAIAKSNADNIGLGTEIKTFSEPITKESVAKELRSCDLIFGCTDKEKPRAILIQLSLRYIIPIIDLGVVIDSKDGQIRDVVGRVTTLLPGEACLFCRKRINPETIRLEGLSLDERQNLIQEGYAPELQEPNPAVVTFTSATAALATSELLHRLTGYMGSDRKSTEVLCFFDKARIRTNRPKPAPDCICSQHALWGRGDSVPFLGAVWAA